jgi:hypothetical protein
MGNNSSKVPVCVCYWFVESIKIPAPVRWCEFTALWALMYTITVDRAVLRAAYLNWQHSRERSENVHFAVCIVYMTVIYLM